MIVVRNPELGEAPAGNPPTFAMGEKLGAAVEEHRTVHGHFSAQFYPGATFNNRGDASYEDGRYYPKLIEIPTRFSKTVRMS